MHTVVIKEIETYTFVFSPDSFSKDKKELENEKTMFLIKK